MRALSGFKPTGHLQLGNYLGAIRPMVRAVGEPIVMIVDLHALTVEHDPARVRSLTLEQVAVLLACGVDPKRSTLYVQSHVPEHTELHYLLECATGYGEAHRMIQFKEKASEQQHVRLSLLTYPVLMAADILLHDATEVPVGEDQRQHVELARDVAIRFNGRYGETFVVPKAVKPPVAARVMDLSDPAAKMGKSNANGGGVIALLDGPDAVVRKVMRAVTDAGTTVVYDPQHRRGVANLLEILAACRNEDPAGLAAEFTSYGALKRSVADAVVELLRPIQARYAELANDPGYLAGVLAAGAARARERASGKVAQAKAAMGLLDLHALPRLT
jgi:tryptophanyl-tRNA synthetase